MIVTVAVRDGAPVVGLDDPEDCGRFSVSAPGLTAEAAAEALTAADAGETADEAGHVRVRVDAVRAAAAGRVAADWEDRFAGMLGYARSKGWLDESGSAITAHLELEAPAG